MGKDLEPARLTPWVPGQWIPLRVEAWEPYPQYSGWTARVATRTLIAISNAEASSTVELRLRPKKDDNNDR